MKTRLMHMESIPDSKELISLLGENLYESYHMLCNFITSSLSPNLEIWDYAGRRGKYFHGYRISEKRLSIDWFLLSVNKQGVVKCEFRLNKIFFSNILKKKGFFSENTQESIDSCVEINQKHGGYSLEIFISNETLKDAIKIIEIVSM